MVESICVASWNIWIHGNRDFKAMADLIRKNKIDIIGLQEVGVYFDGKKEDMAKEIARELGYNYVFYPSYKPAVRQGQPKPALQGNAVISKFPITKTELIQLNPKNVVYNGHAETEPRILIRAVIKVAEGKSINFLTTHL